MNAFLVFLCTCIAIYMASVGDWFGFSLCGVAACLNGLNWIDDAKRKALMRKMTEENKP